ncbi:unnamed protein product [Diplocarpon coronariae]|uniref:DUF7730 domain-containing protein n=1 Tax=Diplocarpon coronariae TaxID=2795749 RepID=A0A218ZGQ4_9HELO|nr:hypothetical protein JHW43_006952 [Diplocarpon mali]OWP07207.1 hypothetical protein B2J93_1980 [Marssonina coronariae]
MARDKEHRPAGLTGKAVFGFLSLVTGRSKEEPWVSSPESDRNPHRRYPDARIKSNYQPPPITPSRVKRPRPLTPSPATKKLFFHDEQEQSPLLKLPDEALNLIYQYVLGNRLVHVVRLNSGLLSHTVCRVRDPNLHEQRHEKCHEQRCRGLKLPTGFHIKPPMEQENLLPLLQTCRKIYSSAIHILYSTNIFDFDSIENPIRLSTTLLPHRFDSLQRLSLDLRFCTSSRHSQGTPANDCARWERLWRVIGSMKGLQEAWVRIEWQKDDVGLVKERMWLDELSMVQRLRTFVVELPGLKKHEVLIDEGFRRLNGEWGFVVTRRSM